MNLVEEAIKINNKKVDYFDKNNDYLKVGIMGGTFNPIHIGHLSIAEHIKDNFNLDKIIFIPTGNPPHKKLYNIENRHRYEMVLISIMDNKDFLAFDFELKNDKYSYTVDTLSYLKGRYKNIEFYFIVGADTVLELETWKDFKKNFYLSKFIASERPGIKKDFYEYKLKELKEKYNADIFKANPPLLDISSTRIRENINLGKSIKYSVLKDIENYIIKNNLYREVL